AERVAPYAQAEALQKAWAAVTRKDKEASKLLAAVPAEQRSAGYIFAESVLLRREKKLPEAAAAIAKAPKDGESLVDADAWWIWRRLLCRDLMDAGQFRLAYEVAAGHSAESAVNAAEAEFQAGWIALRALKDPQTAARHFSRIAE